MDAGAGSQGLLREPAHPGRVIVGFCVMSPPPLVLSPDYAKYQGKNKVDISGAAWKLPQAFSQSGPFKGRGKWCGVVQWELMSPKVRVSMENITCSF